MAISNTTPPRRFLGIALVAVLAFQIGCGTILYPERRGQKAGKYDTDIVLLDAVGLLFFLVPGVIAFAVDFATGTIYLPSGGSSRTREVLGQLDTIQLDPQDPTLRDPESLARLIELHTGCRVSLESGHALRFESETGVDVARQLSELTAVASAAQAATAF